MIAKINKLNQLHKIMKKSEREYYDIIHKELDKFKKKFFKDKEEKVTKISIFHVLDENWSNALSYVRCFYCKNEYNSWWKIDEKLDFEYEEYDLKKLQEAEEISQDEYERLRDVIIEQARKDEVDKIRIKYNELKQERFK